MTKTYAIFKRYIEALNTQFFVKKKTEESSCSVGRLRPLIFCARKLFERQKNSVTSLFNYAKRQAPIDPYLKRTSFLVIDNPNGK